MGNFFTGLQRFKQAGDAVANLAARDSVR